MVAPTEDEINKREAKRLPYGTIFRLTCMKGEKMQINIKTKRGTVELSFSKLRIFRRLNRLEERMQAAEEKIKKLIAVAEGCPYKNRTAEPVERREPERGRGNTDQYTGEELYLAWTEGEEAVNQLRAERARVAKGGSGV